MFFYKMNYVHDTKAAAHQPAHQSAYRPAIKAPPRLKPQPHQHRPFDPDDLTRRLYVVLAEQKALEERKRRAKAAVEAERQAKAAAVARDAEGAGKHGQGIPLRVRTQGVQYESAEHPREADSSIGNSVEASPSIYRHVPQVAASQFARTTSVKTATEKSLSRRLSRQIQTVATTTEADQKSSSSSLKSKGSDHEALKHSRRKSTGSVLSKLVPAGFQRHSLIVLDNQSVYDHSEVVDNPDEQRVDWTQSDEEAANKQKSAAQTRLRSKLGSLSKHGKSDKSHSPTEDKESPTGLSPKSPKIGGFFNLTSDDYEDNIQRFIPREGNRRGV